SDYIRIGSALGSGAPVSIIILPVLFEGQVKAVIELASFSKFNDIHQTFLDQLTESIGVVLHTISANMQTEYLLHQSQSLTAELRTPLNSLLILARLLADNVGGNLTAKQVEFARTIHASGAELLALINDILDLAKIESGTVTLNIAEERFAELTDYVERTFRQLAADKGLEFHVSVGRDLPAAMESDGKRLQQIITNLLSNAFKFTNKGAVS